ncbi:hypothetical protein ACIQGO_25610 [Streptomyces shenzhenensis]|uniref:hypothetical protein n=1 Tax=Streptomyces shenzhenensis TaxID=943815 RepID=UPI003806C640
MRAIRVASAALLGPGALVLCASAAMAEDGGGSRTVTPFGFGVEPSTVAAGSKVTLRLDRNDGCTGGATVTSDIFDTVRIPSGRSSATTTVGTDVRSGTSYRVTFSCDGASGSTDLKGADGGRDSGVIVESPEDSDSSGTQVPGAVQAGDGGSIAGFDLGEIGLGTVLIAGAIGTAWRLAHDGTGDDA